MLYSVETSAYIALALYSLVDRCACFRALVRYGPDPEAAQGLRERPSGGAVCLQVAFGILGGPLKALLEE